MWLLIGRKQLSCPASKKTFVPLLFWTLEKTIKNKILMQLSQKQGENKAVEKLGFLQPICKQGVHACCKCALHFSAQNNVFKHLAWKNKNKMLTMQQGTREDLQNGQAVASRQLKSQVESCI